MRIAIDSRFLLPHLEGFGRFTKEVASRLVREHSEIEWDLLFDRKPLPHYHFGSAQRSIVLPPPTRHWTLYELWWRLSVPWYVRSQHPQAFFATYGIVSRPVAKRTPTVAFIHDVAFARHPEFLPKDWQAYYMRSTRETLRYATLLIANSQSVRNDLIELFQVPSEKIRIAHNGCNTSFFRPLPDLDKAAVQQRYTAGVPYLLYVGSIHPRKNPERLLLAYDLLRQRYRNSLRLLMVGRFMFRRYSLEMLTRLHYRHEVIFQPPVPDEALLELYNAAEVVVYPSLYEGFGYPVAEALACGVPVVTSRVSSLPEVGGEAAFYADPYDPASIAQAMYAALTQSPADRHQRAILGRTHVMQFSWEKCVDAIWRAIQHVVE